MLNDRITPREAAVSFWKQIKVAVGARLPRVPRFLTKLHAPAWVLQTTLFLFIYLAWQVDSKFTRHGELIQAIGRNAFFIKLQVNALPHLLASILYRPGPAGGEHITSLGRYLYLAFLLALIFNQTRQLWAPYLLQRGAMYADEQTLAAWVKGHQSDHRILPAFGGRQVVPDTENTVLFTLLLLTLLMSFQEVGLFSRRDRDLGPKESKAKERRHQPHGPRPRVPSLDQEAPPSKND